MIFKVKGHASRDDVAAGRTTFSDKCANDKADELAVLGASLHAVCQKQKVDFKYRTFLAMDLQKMMLDILTAREDARRGTGVNVISSSSEDSHSDSASDSENDGEVSYSNSCEEAAGAQCTKAMR